MSDTSEPKRCPKCGLTIPAEAPQGLCPKCVLAQASIPTESAKAQPAPTRAEIAAAFPQLEILELIGQGGMGFVFKARQPKLERLVALKILPQALAADPAFAERFSREGRLLARLNHPNIVTIHDFGQAGGYFYLLMEFVDGVNLRDAMRAGRFTPAQALVVVPKICEALQFAHNEGILHRDIKPENILVDVRGRVKIADFGIAKLVGDAQSETGLTGSGRTLGTPHYMAPEQLEKPGEVDHRADIYSLGVVFYEMLTGELPLGRFQPPSHRVEMDVRLDEVVLHALEKEPSRRYQQASHVKTAVETIAGGTQPIPVAPASDRFWRRMAIAMALLCLTLIVFIVCFARMSFLAQQRAMVALQAATVPAGAPEKESGTLKRVRAHDAAKAHARGQINSRRDRDPCCHVISTVTDSRQTSGAIRVCAVVQWRPDDQDRFQRLFQSRPEAGQCAKHVYLMRALHVCSLRRNERDAMECRCGFWLDYWRVCHQSTALSQVGNPFPIGPSFRKPVGDPSRRICRAARRHQPGLVRRGNALDSSTALLTPGSDRS